MLEVFRRRNISSPDKNLVSSESEGFSDSCDPKSWRDSQLVQWLTRQERTYGTPLIGAIVAGVAVSFLEQRKSHLSQYSENVDLSSIQKELSVVRNLDRWKIARRIGLSVGKALLEIIESHED